MVEELFITGFSLSKISVSFKFGYFSGFPPKERSLMNSAVIKGCSLATRFMTEFIDFIRIA